MENDAKLGELLKRVRESKGLSVLRASKDSGLSRNSIDKVEKGDKRVASLTLQKYINFLDIPETLLEGIIDRKKVQSEVNLTITFSLRPDIARAFLNAAHECGGTLESYTASLVTKHHQLK